MSAAQVTEAHIRLANQLVSSPPSPLVLATLIADSEALACDQLRAEVERLRHLEALLNQAAAEVTAHTFTAGGIAGLRAELALLREWQREVIQNANAHHAERKDAIARAERAELRVKQLEESK